MITRMLMLACTVSLGAAARADVICVPDDHDTIQAAIDAAADGDEICVAPGIYVEAIDLLGKAVRLYGTGGAEATTLDVLDLVTSAVTCTSGEGPDTIIEGFTFTGGRGTFRNEPVPTTYGGGMYIVGSSPTVKDCTFIDNACGLGGGMQNFDGSHPTLIRCRFIDNEVNINGGGIFAMRSCSPTILNCVFQGNRCGHVGGGLAIREDCHPLVVNSAFIDNYAGDFGGAVRSGNTGSSPTFVNTLFYGNEAADVGGAYAAGSDSTGTVGHSLLVNCIFRANTAPLGPQIALNGLRPADATVTYCNVEGGEAGVYVENGFTLTWREGNIDDDPLLADPEAGDFRLAKGSPCVDAGVNGAVPADAFDLDADGDHAERVPRDLGAEHRFMDVAGTRDPGCGTVVVDMGPHEHPGTPMDPVLIGDVDGDGTIGFDDLSALLDAWGPCDPACCLADVNFSWAVDFEDLLLVLSNWS